MEHKALLLKIDEITSKHRLIRRQTGGDFNIFKVAGIADDEVILCRVICDLINPRGSHRQGTLYLKEFFCHVLGKNPNESDLEVARVYREYVIDENRRIDLVIETPDMFIPIEVKIYAGDQPAQCHDYLTFLKNKGGKKDKLYYLTRFGTEPEEISYINFGDLINISCCSWSVNILNWLSACLTLQESVRISSIRETLVQMITVVKAMTNQLEDACVMEIKELLLSSPTALQAALDIEKALPSAKAVVMKNLFEQLETQMTATGYPALLSDTTAYATFYKSGTKALPQMLFEVAKLNEHLMGVMGIEVSWNLYFYFGFWNVIDHELLSVADVESEYPEEFNRFKSAVLASVPKCKNQTEQTFYWDYICTVEGDQYNFKDFSDSCLRLMGSPGEGERIFHQLYGYVEGVATAYQKQSGGEAS